MAGHSGACVYPYHWGTQWPASLAQGEGWGGEREGGKERGGGVVGEDSGKVTERSSDFSFSSKSTGRTAAWERAPRPRHPSLTLAPPSGTWHLFTTTEREGQILERTQVSSEWKPLS